MSIILSILRTDRVSNPVVCTREYEEKTITPILRCPGYAVSNNQRDVEKEEEEEEGHFGRKKSV